MQQILWTLIAIGIFVVMIVRNYATNTALPEVPEELLILMGISSAGYLAGKAARKPGPIVHAVQAFTGSLKLKIEGDNLSKDAVIWVDGVQLQEKPSATLSELDKPMEFARELVVTVKKVEPEDKGDGPASQKALMEWHSVPHVVVVVNADGQRSEWQSTPRIVNVTTDLNLKGEMFLSIEAEYMRPESVIEVTGATIIEKPQQVPGVPNRWAMTVAPAEKGKPFELVVRYGKDQSSKYVVTG